VLVEEKKLAGVLCEMHLPGGVIVGVGLNRHFAGERPSDGAIALAECMPVDDATVDAIMAGFVERLRGWQTLGQTGARTSGQPGAQTVGPAEAHAYVSGTLVSAKRAVEVVPVAGASWRGVAQGLNVNGHLIVRTREGVDIEIVAADVHHLYQ
jgi:biotin-(acetyl-CoA carboxylase) ligase